MDRMMGRLLIGMAVLWSYGVVASQPVLAAEDMSAFDESVEPESAPIDTPQPEATPQVNEEPARISMEFQDAKLRDVLKAFSQQSGINMIASQEAGDQLITVYLEDVTFLDALDQILRSGNFAYDRPEGSDIYIVRPKPEGATKTMTRVYRLKYARVSKSILAKAGSTFNGITPYEALRQPSSSENQGNSGSSSGGGVGSSGGGGGGGFGGSGGGAQQEDVGIDLVVKDLLTDEGQVVVDARTNSLLITDVPENFPRLEAAIMALDVRTPQVMVDAEVIETTLSKLKDLGFEWGGSTGTVFSFTPGTGTTTRFPFSFFGEHHAPTGPSPFGTTTLSFHNFEGVLHALETDTDTKILARPKILTLDNESAVIRLTTDEAIGFQTTTGEQTATTSSQPERTTTGVVLVVTPQINEGGYITMLVEPSVSKTVASKITAPSGQSDPRDPKTRSSRNMVRIRSGDTLVVGGLIDRSDATSVRRVPILGHMPIIGEVFKSTDIDNSTSELIVFITPRILEEPGVDNTLASTPASRTPWSRPAPRAWRGRSLRL